MRSLGKEPGQVRLLIVHEHSEFFEQIKDCADMCRHECRVLCEFTQSRESAEQLIHDWEPTVVVLDMHIPGMSSYDVLAKCRANAIPVVATSEFPSDEIEQSAIKNGAGAYLPRPEDPETLEIFLKEAVQIALPPYGRH